MNAKRKLSEFPVAAQIRVQKAWIASAGGNLQGYVKTFGDADIAAQHWEEDVAELNRLLKKQKREG